MMIFLVGIKKPRRSEVLKVVKLFIN